MGIEAHMNTTKGTIVLTLFPEDAPVTVANFVNLANREFYDGVVFHRVISDFMIQGGDPTGTGRGGPGYRFEDEFQSGRKFDKKGVLAMANAGPGTNGSQFFITHVPTPHLNNHHTIFGEVKEGQEVVDSIAQGDKIESLNIIGEIEDFVAEMNDRIGSWKCRCRELFW
ncbi:MAG: peptidylprolyl isomerase [Candidatus Omnitrophica bacterium]|nr:peptidylprolyl isomerase [Candidatus Omnitrophota bacterium]